MPEDISATMPTICVATNIRSPPHNDLDHILLVAQIDHIVDFLKPWSIQWQKEGRLKEQCFLMLRYLDIAVYLVVEGK
jgi:hypothetical protein